MRLFAFHLSVALLVFGFSSPLLNSCVSAQEKPSAENEIGEKDFKELLARATEKLEGKTYRLTKTEEYFADRDAKSESIKVNILEIVPPDKRREIEEVKSPTKNSKIERIWDGNYLYERENNGEWKKYSGSSSVNGDYTSGRTTTTYKFTGKELLNNKTANVYESESHRVANKLTQTSQYRVEYVVKTKYWISRDGLFLKTTKESEIVGSKSLAREVEIYKYDPRIKIKAPIK